jgi:dTDP-4-amino-4,6-dideoxygalactose transaminase
MINVNKPFLPPIEDYESYLEGIWKRNWLTNNGPLVNELERKLKEYLSINGLLYLNNGTIAIQLAIKALGLKGEIITTPFSYVATTSSIVWENCIPVFADIDSRTFNINPELIEKVISPKTTAILATHVFGNPCNIKRIEEIADKHRLKVIYDASHCFGSQYGGKSVFDYGDISTTSFHATKLFHTIEGGAVFTNNSQLLKNLAFMRNFGHDGPDSFQGLGINGKNSELHAAMGLCNFAYLDDILKSRKELYLHYLMQLKGLPVQFQLLEPGSKYNYAYFPIVFESEERLLSVIKKLNSNWIYPRRYFYPSLNSLNYLKPQPTPVSEEISSRILCLPLYYGLSREEIDFICNLLLVS